MRCRKCDFDGEGLRALLIKRETDLASTRIALEKSQHELAELLEAHQTVDTQLIRERDTARAALEEAQAKITAAVNVLSAPPAYGWNAYATKIRDALAILEGEK